MQRDTLLRASKASPCRVDFPPPREALLILDLGASKYTVCFVLILLTQNSMNYSNSLVTAI